MKNLLLLFCGLLVTHLCHAQTLRMDQVPPAVHSGFKIKFPNGQQPAWSKEGTDIFEVGFINGKKHQTALFDATGKWMETETEINYGAAPAKVQRAFENEFEGFQIQEVFETETPDKGLTYEIIAFKGKENYEVVFSSKGELLKKEKGSEVDE